MRRNRAKHPCLATINGVLHQSPQSHLPRMTRPISRPLPFVARARRRQRRRIPSNRSALARLVNWDNAPWCRTQTKRWILTAREKRLQIVRSMLNTARLSQPPNSKARSAALPQLREVSIRLVPVLLRSLEVASETPKVSSFRRQRRNTSRVRVLILLHLSTKSVNLVRPLYLYHNNRSPFITASERRASDGVFSNGTWAMH